MRRVIGVLLTSLCACGGGTPLATRSTLLEPGKYAIRIPGVDATDAVVSAFRRRANELCPHGHELTDATKTTDDRGAPEVYAVVQCHKGTGGVSVVGKGVSTETGPGSFERNKRRDFARAWNTPKTKQDGLSFRTEGDLAEVFVIEGHGCGADGGVLSKLDRVSVNDMRRAGFKRVVCVGGASDEAFDL